jgi:hypothetical protein
MERLTPNSCIRQRKPISASEGPFLAAIARVVEDHREYWPISLRRVHYSLLNQQVIRNTRTGSLYVNDWSSYHACGDLLLRARINGRVPWEAIEDAARAVVLPRCDADREVFINRERRWFLEGYRRNHMQSQDAHIEDVFEKLTVQSILEPIADKFTLPLVPMRGMTSGTAKQALADRFSTSGKGTLMLLIAGDLDRRSPMTCSTTSSAMPAWTRTNSRRGSSRLPAGTPGQPYQTTEPIKPPMTFDQRLSSIPPARPDPVPNTYDFAGSSTRFRTPGYPAFRENIPR